MDRAASRWTERKSHREETHTVQNGMYCAMGPHTGTSKCLPALLAVVLWEEAVCDKHSTSHEDKNSPSGPDQDINHALRMPQREVLVKAWGPFPEDQDCPKDCSVCKFGC